MNKAIVTQKLTFLRERISRELATEAGRYLLDQEILSFYEKYAVISTELREGSRVFFGDLIDRKPTRHELADRSEYIEPRDLQLLVSDIDEILRLLPFIAENSIGGIREDNGKLWSQRLKPARANGWQDEFFLAFKAVISRLSIQNYFAEHFGRSCDQCLRRNGLLESLLDERLKEHLPLSPGWGVANRLGESQILDFVEFFGLFVSKAIKVEDCWNGEVCPAVFFRPEGIDDYDREVNVLFDRFGAPFRISNGVLYRSNSVLIDELFQELPISNDQRLNEMISKSVALYREPRTDRRIEAVDSLVKAWEYVKSSYGSDIKVSVENLLRDVVQDSGSRKIVDDLWQSGSKFIHLGIRHATKNSAVIEDPELAGYVFLVTYVSILFAISQTERQSKELRDTALGLNSKGLNMISKTF